MKLSHKSFLYFCSFFSLLGAASAMPGSDEENKLETSNPAPAAVAHFKAKDVLPLDIWGQIVQHLTPQDKLRLMRVNQFFRSFVLEFITEFITKPQNSEEGGFLAREAYAWLATFPNLSSFKLKKNFDIRDETHLRFPALQTFLRSSNLKKLDLSGNVISNSPNEGTLEHPIVDLMQSLPKSIEEIDLSNNGIYIDPATHHDADFFEPLAKKQKLRGLNLSEQKISDLDLGLRIVELLKTTSIEKLNLEVTGCQNLSYIGIFIANAPEMALTDLYVCSAGRDTEMLEEAYAGSPVLNRNGKPFNVHFKRAS